MFQVYEPSCDCPLGDADLSKQRREETVTTDSADVFVKIIEFQTVHGEKDRKIQMFFGFALKR